LGQNVVERVGFAVKLPDRPVKLGAQLGGIVAGEGECERAPLAILDDKRSGPERPC
jgi:hypothetical protein